MIERYKWNTRSHHKKINHTTTTIISRNHVDSNSTSPHPPRRIFVGCGATPRYGLPSTAPFGSRARVAPGAASGLSASASRGVAPARGEFSLPSDSPAPSSPHRYGLRSTTRHSPNFTFSSLDDNVRNIQRDLYERSQVPLHTF